MAASEITICSNASMLVGGGPIASLEETTDRARLAKSLWEPVRNYVLRRHPWKCATKRVSLAPDGVTPAFDWDYQFTLPADFVRMLSVGERDVEADYLIESGKLLCNDNPALVRYIWRNESVPTYDDMLVWGLTMSMKAAFAYPLTQSASLEQIVDAALEVVLKQARAVDGQDIPPQTMGDTPLMTARMGGRRWS